MRVRKRAAPRGPAPGAPTPIFGPTFVRLLPKCAPLSTSLTLAPVTAFGLSFERVTAFFFSCLLPTLFAGGGFRHGQHLAFDQQNNYPLTNLFVSMLQRMGIEEGSFASSTGAFATIPSICRFSFLKSPIGSAPLRSYTLWARWLSVAVLQLSVEIPSSRHRSAQRTISAPTPGGPPNLCADIAT